jgi:hypothetical protein
MLQLYASEMKHNLRCMGKDIINSIEQVQQKNIPNVHYSKRSACHMARSHIGTVDDNYYAVNNIQLITCFLGILVKT